MTDSVPAETTNTGIVVRAKSRLQVMKRRELVAQWRLRDNLSFPEIAKRLALEDPPIVVDQSILAKDVRQAQNELKARFSRGRFDAGIMLAQALIEIDDIAWKARADAEDTKDKAKRAALYRVRLDAIERRISLLQESGLLTKELGRMLLDVADGKNIDRIPDGTELAKRFSAIKVLDADLVSDAEKAWLYGDAQESDDAANEAIERG